MSLPTRGLAVAGAALTALIAPVALAAPALASSTANEIVYTADDNNDGLYGIVLRDLESRKVSVVLPPSTTEEWIYDDPELSDDGGRIAFSTDRGAADFEEGIAVVNRDGSGFRRLTNPVTTDDVYRIDVAASWRPDGATILFTRITVDSTDPDNPVESTALFTVPSAGGAVAPVANAGDGYTADYSPDGSRIVFAALPTAAGTDSPDQGPLTVVNADGTGGRTALGPTGLMPAWSPDGSTIAYATVSARDSDRDRAFDSTRIGVVPAGGGSGRVFAASQPSSAPSVSEYPSWTPDGNAIVYDVFGYSTTDTFPPGDLYAIDKDGVRAGKVTDTPGDEAQAHTQGPRPGSVSPGAGSTYTPVTPTRILDTRDGTGVPQAKVGPGGTVRLAVRGAQTASGAVPANASAVVMNLTVTGTTSSTDVRAYPSGSAIPLASNLNAAAGTTVPNLVTVRIGSDGAIVLRNSGGTVQLIGDIAGYYTPDGGGAGFAAVDPSRILDTRSGVGAPTGKIGPADQRDLQVTGALRTADGGTVTVPSDARAVVLNVTATGASSGTDVRVYPTPTDGSVPEVSNLNVRTGQTAPNLVTVAVGDGGKVRLRNLAGRIDLIADLAGYYSASAPGKFVPVDPTRFLDTRSGVGGAPIPTTGAAFVDLRLGGTRGVPSGATAAVINLTGTSVTASTDVRAYPLGSSSVPTVSNLNLTKGLTRANLAIVRLGDQGGVRVRNGAGSVNLIGDLAGYMIN